MLLGTTSFALRYRYLDPAGAPLLEDELEPLRRLGVEVLQICENVRPWEFTAGRWAELKSRASALGMQLRLGCMTIEPDVLLWHIRQAARQSLGPTVRVIFELDKGSGSPNHLQVQRLLDHVMPELESLDFRLAIENHFDLSSMLLAEVAKGYPSARIGFCIDTANSLRKFETATTVFDLLEDRALQYHFKDYSIEGSNVGFRVAGAPLGSGLLNLRALLERVRRRTADPEIFVENWVPSTGDFQADAATDAEWLAAGIRAVRANWPAVP